MSSASDDPPSDRVSAGAASDLPAARAESDPSRSGQPRTANEEVREGTDPQKVTADNGEPPAPRPRRRRRRRRPRDAAVADAVASSQNEHKERAAGATPQPGEFPTKPLGGDVALPRRRHRHRSTGPNAGREEVRAGERAQTTEGAPPFGPGSARRGALPGAGDAQGATTQYDGPPPAHPGRRRRRRRPSAAAVSVGERASGGEAPPEGSAPATLPLVQNAARQTAPEGGRAPQLGKLGGRRRRRRFPRSATTMPPDEHQAADQSAEGTSATAPNRRVGPHRGLQSRGPRDGHDRNEATDERRLRDVRPGDQVPGGRPRELTGSRPDGREQSLRVTPERRKGAPGPRDRRRRNESEKRPEQRLYALESVVDRGFEDVPDETDNATRRVHWTITKRTVADQQSGKPISATYVLKRDEVDTEFPSLGTARAAANKTIVHPEKLTLSKAEHAAAKK